MVINIASPLTEKGIKQGHEPWYQTNVMIAMATVLSYMSVFLNILEHWSCYTQHHPAQSPYVQLSKLSPPPPSLGSLALCLSFLVYLPSTP